MNDAQQALDAELTAVAGILGEGSRALHFLDAAIVSNKAGDSLVTIECLAIAIREAGAGCSAFERLKSCEVMALQLAHAEPPAAPAPAEAVTDPAPNTTATESTLTPAPAAAEVQAATPAPAAGANPFSGPLVQQGGGAVVDVLRAGLAALGPDNPSAKTVRDAFGPLL